MGAAPSLTAKWCLMTTNRGNLFDLDPILHLGCHLSRHPAGRLGITPPGPQQCVVAVPLAAPPCLHDSQFAPHACVRLVPVCCADRLSAGIRSRAAKTRLNAAVAPPAGILSQPVLHLD